MKLGLGSRAPAAFGVLLVSAALLLVGSPSQAAKCNLLYEKWSAPAPASETHRAQPVRPNEVTMNSMAVPGRRGLSVGLEVREGTVGLTFSRGRLKGDWIDTASPVVRLLDVITYVRGGKKESLVVVETRDGIETLVIEAGFRFRRQSILEVRSEEQKEGSEPSFIETVTTRVGDTPHVLLVHGSGKMLRVGRINERGELFYLGNLEVPGEPAEAAMILRSEIPSLSPHELVFSHRNSATGGHEVLSVDIANTGFVGTYRVLLATEQRIDHLYETSGVRQLDAIASDAWSALSASPDPFRGRRSVRMIAVRTSNEIIVLDPVGEIHARFPSRTSRERDSFENQDRRIVEVPDLNLTAQLDGPYMYVRDTAGNTAPYRIGIEGAERIVGAVTVEGMGGTSRILAVHRNDQSGEGYGSVEIFRFFENGTFESLGVPSLPSGTRNLRLDNLGGSAWLTGIRDNVGFFQDGLNRPQELHRWKLTSSSGSLVLDPSSGSEIFTALKRVETSDGSIRFVAMKDQLLVTFDLKASGMGEPRLIAKLRAGVTVLEIGAIEAEGILISGGTSARAGVHSLIHVRAIVDGKMRDLLFERNGNEVVADTSPQDKTYFDSPGTFGIRSSTIPATELIGTTLYRLLREPLDTGTNILQMPSESSPQVGPTTDLSPPPSNNRRPYWRSSFDDF